MKGKRLGEERHVVVVHMVLPSPVERNESSKLILLTHYYHDPIRYYVLLRALSKPTPRGSGDAPSHGESCANNSTSNISPEAIHTE